MGNALVMTMRYLSVHVHRQRLKQAGPIITKESPTQLQFDDTQNPRDAGDSLCPGQGATMEA